MVPSICKAVEQLHTPPPARNEQVPMFKSSAVRASCSTELRSRCCNAKPETSEKMSKDLWKDMSDELSEELSKPMSEELRGQEALGEDAGPVQQSGEPAVPLPAAVRAKIERNRQRALLLRQARTASQPYPSASTRSQVGATRLRGPSRAMDTGGGFLLDEAEEEVSATAARRVVHAPAPMMKGDDLQCADCGRHFMDSYLSDTFELAVCDTCRDNEGKHQLVSRTEAKLEFLLKDCDLDAREPPLRFVLRKNPHNPRWGDMKLYLRLQVEKRALDVWGSEEALEEAREQRHHNRDRLQQKRFSNKIKELRMSVRSSLYRKGSTSHVHEYGPEQRDTDSEDVFHKTCAECGHRLSYEKM